MTAENSKTPRKKIVIVGGVAGGMSAAARARRLSETAEIIVIERSGYVSYANCGLPYYMGGEIEAEEQLLVATPESLKAKLNIIIRVHQEATKIDRQARTITIKKLDDGSTYEESYDELILSVGAQPVKPRLPGIDSPGLFTVRSIEDVQKMQTWITSMKPKTAVIAGGGFIGLEMAEQLAQRGLSVTLIDGKDQVLTPIDPEMAALLHGELRKHGVQLALGKPIEAFLPPSAVASPNGTPRCCWVKAGDGQPIAADMVILGLGVRPEVSMAREAGLAIGDRGGIRVNDHLQTSDEHIWAVGDAIEVRHPINNNYTLIALGGPANRQGRIAADNIFGTAKTYAGTIGTAIIRVFELTAAATGLNETQLREASISYETVYIHPSHHAGYYPGAQRLDMKVMFGKDDGKLLGAQIVGKEGADKRIDVIATAIKAGMTIRDLAELELAYAPPFGSAKDPINLAGMAGTNALDGLVSQVQWHELPNLKAHDVCLVDVRTSGERSRGTIPGSIHIALPELRNRLQELPRERKIIVFCQSGQRSYLAARILTQQGYNAAHVSGGYLTWSTMNSNSLNSIAGRLLPTLQSTPN